jgi:hypothetical protein
MCAASAEKVHKASWLEVPESQSHQAPSAGIVVVPFDVKEVMT